MKGLTVIECPYPYAAWSVQRVAETLRFASEERLFSHREMVEDYRLCGVYDVAGVPVDICRLDRSTHDGDPMHVAVPREVSDIVCEAISAGRNVLMSSGYCVYVPAMLGGLQRALGEDARIGLVWIDAHADCVVVEQDESPSTTMVGVPVSSSLGLSCPTWRKDVCGLALPLRTEDVVMSDLRRTDDESLEIVQDAGCVVLDSEAFEAEGPWESAILDLASRVDVLHVAVDADILDARYIPAYFRREPGGHTPWKVLKNLECVFATGKVCTVSTLCFDFDKGGIEGDATCLNGMRIVAGALRLWSGR